MKIKKNPLLDTWEMAESTEPVVRHPNDLEPCNGKLILVVDDDAHIRALYKKTLNRCFPDCTVELAVDGQKGVEMFSETHPAIVLLDYLMPNMNGEEAFFKMLECCEAKGWKKPSFLFCTGCNPPPSLHNAVASDPAHCLLHKPIRTEIFKEAVGARLAKQTDAS
jgi:CheY-like chemotaxis protein